MTHHPWHFSPPPRFRLAVQLRSRPALCGWPSAVSAARRTTGYATAVELVTRKNLVFPWENGGLSMKNSGLTMRNGGFSWEDHGKIKIEWDK